MAVHFRVGKLQRAAAPGKLVDHQYIVKVTLQVVIEPASGVVRQCFLDIAFLLVDVERRSLRGSKRRAEKNECSQNPSKSHLAPQEYPQRFIAVVAAGVLDYLWWKKINFDLRD